MSLTSWPVRDFFLSYPVAWNLPSCLRKPQRVVLKHQGNGDKYHLSCKNFLLCLHFSSYWHGRCSHSLQLPAYFRRIQFLYLSVSVLKCDTWIPRSLLAVTTVPLSSFYCPSFFQGCEFLVKYWGMKAVSWGKATAWLLIFRCHQFSFSFLMKQKEKKLCGKATWCFAEIVQTGRLWFVSKIV